MYYVYEYFDRLTGKVFYVGAGSKNRLFDQGQRRKEFHRTVALRNTSVRVYKMNLSREEAIKIETERIAELKKIGEAQINKEIKGKITVHSDETKVKKSVSGQNKVFTEKHRRSLSKGASVHDPKVKGMIRDTLKGRNTRNEYWLITLVDGSRMTFNNRQKVADYFGVSKSLVNNWKYGTISARWKQHIKKVELKEKNNDKKTSSIV